MLKELFESSFYATFPHKPNVTINIREDTFCNSFSLYDPVACSQCDSCRIGISSKENINILSCNDVKLIRIDQVINYVQEDLGDNCDCMLADQDTVAFIEMTCSLPEYVNNSKRNKARSQLYNTLVIFHTAPNIKNFISSKCKKYIIFSWKNTDARIDRAEQTEQNFLIFSDFSDEVYSIDNTQKFDFDFLFKEVRYPDVLDWSSL